MLCSNFFYIAVYLKAIQVNSTSFAVAEPFCSHFFFFGWGGGGVVAHWQMIVKFKHNFVYVRWVGKTSHREGNKKIKNAEHPPHDQTVFLLTFSTLCKMQKPLSCYRSHKNRTEGQMNSWWCPQLLEHFAHWSCVLLPTGRKQWGIWEVSQKTRDEWIFLYY